MTDYERIRDKFNATAVCHLQQRPVLDYEPGCAFIQCERGDTCKCQLGEHDTLPAKTCPRCFGTGQVLRNAGTGLLGLCPLCSR